MQTPGRLAEGVNTVSVGQDRAQARGMKMSIVRGLREILVEDRSLAAVPIRRMLAEQRDDVESAERGSGP